jgi:hypothetical protein
MGGHRRPRRVSDDAEWGGGTFLHVCNASRLIYIRKKKKKKKNHFVLPCSSQHKQRRRRIPLSVICGMNEDVKNLSNTCSTIKAVLEDAKNKQGNNPQLKIISIMKFISATTTEEETRRNRRARNTKHFFSYPLSKLQALFFFFFLFTNYNFPLGKHVQTPMEKNQYGFALIFSIVVSLGVVSFLSCIAAKLKRTKVAL